MMLRAVISLTLLVLGPGSLAAEQEPAEVTVGSKKFTESVVLGELIVHAANDAGARPSHLEQLGGTSIVFAALLNGDIDVYAEYTGTLIKEILASEQLDTADQVRASLAHRGIQISAPLGFNNTYALGMKKPVAGKLKITRISDLVDHPDLAIGFTNEFMDRADGWPGLRKHYGLPQENVVGMDHDVAYRGLDGGSIHVTDLYSTDADIRYYDLAILTDDRRYFPEYQCVLLYRADLFDRAPRVVEALLRLEGRIPAESMVAMNARVKVDRVSETRVAADFLLETFSVDSAVTEPGMWDRIARHTLEHLFLVGVSLGAAIVIAVPLGIVAQRMPGPGQAILGAVGAIQTVPALALLVLMIPLLGVAAPPAIAALFLYSLLPIVRNTHAGLNNLSPTLIESADALGLERAARLRLIELPLAMRTILAGIKTSAVLNVGFATLGALIGAGGYGQPIMTGIRLNRTDLLLEGALPAMALAFAIQGLFEILERRVVPKGLRLAPAR